MLPRSGQIREKTGQKSDPKRNPSQISFLDFLGADFGRFSDGFGKVLGMSLEAWRSIFLGFLGASQKPQETTRRHRKNSMPSASAASDRASAASEASGAIEVFERMFFRILGEIHGNHRKEHDIAGETKITKRASRSLT